MRDACGGFRAGAMHKRLHSGIVFRRRYVILHLGFQGRLSRAKTVLTLGGCSR